MHQFDDKIPDPASENTIGIIEKSKEIYESRACDDLMLEYFPNALSLCNSSLPTIMIQISMP
jgi:hypothetical protein